MQLIKTYSFKPADHQQEITNLAEKLYSKMPLETRVNKMVIGLGIIVALAGILMAVLSHTRITPVRFQMHIAGYAALGAGISLVSISGVIWHKKVKFQRESAERQASIKVEEFCKDQHDFQELKPFRQSAPILQKKWRAYKARNDFKNLRKTTVVIQRYMRKHLAVKKTAALHAACLLIQKTARCIVPCVERKKSIQQIARIQSCVRSLLNKSRMQHEKKLSAAIALARSDKLKEQPNPPSGENKANIFILKDLPFVIRRIKLQHYREEAMKKTRARVMENNLHEHLVIPLVTRPQKIVDGRLVPGDFTVETKIPNDYAHPIQGMAFYYLHREEFNAAVESLLVFLSSQRINGLLGGKHTLNDLSKARMPRFDKVIPFTEQKDGKKIYKLGIVDIDNYSVSYPTTSDITSAAYQCINLFPYHFDSIFNKAKRINRDIFPITIDPDFKKDTLKLYEFCERSIEFYKKNNIRPDNQQFVPISSEIKLFIQEKIKQAKLPNGDCILKIDPPAIQKFDNEILPLMFAGIEHVIETILQKKSQSLEEMVENRSTIGPQPVKTAESLAKQLVKDHIAIVESVFSKDAQDSEFVLERIYQEIFKCLVEKEYIPYYTTTKLGDILCV